MRQWRKVRWITVNNYILKYKKNMENLYIPIHVILRWLIG